MLEQLLTAFDFVFFQRALFIGTLLALVCGVLGTYVVVRREAIVGHTLSNMAFLGVTLGLLFHLPLGVTGLLVSCLGVLLLALFSLSQTFTQDSVLSFFEEISMALAVVVLSITPGYRADPMQYLFGDILAISRDDVWLSVGLALGVLLLLFLFRRPFFQISFHRELAQSIGTRVGLYHLLFLFLVACVVAIAMKIVGVILLTAFLVIPTNIARIVAKSFRSLLVLSACFGALGTFVGLILSYLWNLPSGATIILVFGGMLFSFAFIDFLWKSIKNTVLFQKK